MSSAGAAWYDLSARVDQLEADLKQAEGKVAASAKKGSDEFEGQWSKGLGRVRENAGKARNALAAIGVGLGVATVIAFFANAINAASDLNEEVSKSQVVFGESAAGVEEFANRADVALGQSKQQALAAAGAFGNMFRTIGLAEEESATMSTTMVQLASDMASFNNQDPSDMLERLRSGLAGEAEPLRQYGVLLSEARVKQYAWANGIAASGVELTESQKVVARYGVILQDTTLQQGDFARTSEGLANTQRKNAAIWENSLARIGQTLLPLATSLATFAGEVLPDVADAIIDLIHVAEPMVSLLLTLGGLWIEHAKTIVPLVALIYGIKLVGAMKGAAAGMKLTELAAKSLRATLLLGLPLLLEGLEAAGNWVDELKHGKANVEAFDAAVQDLNLSQEEQAIAMAKVLELAKETGASADGVSRSFAYWYEQTGSLEEALKLLRGEAGSTGDEVDDLDESIRNETLAMRQAAAGHREAATEIGETVNGMAADVVDAFNGIEGVVKDSVRAVPGGVAVELTNGTTIVAASADDLADAIPAAVKRAKQEAAAEALLIPGEIAKSILEGRDEVIQAATGFAAAATDPLVQKARITEIRQQLHEITEVTAEEAKNATDASIAEDRRKYAELEIMLAAHLARADPASKEAAGIFAKYLKNADPATRAAYDAVLTALEDRAFVLQHNVEEAAVATSQSLPDALDDARADTIAKAIQTTQAVLREAQNLENPMHQSGFTSGENLGQGVYSARGTARDNVARFGDFVSGPIRYMPSWVWGNTTGKNWGDGLLFSQTYVNDKAKQLRDGVTRFLEFAQSPPYTKVRQIGRNVAREYLASMSAQMKAADALAILGGARDAVGGVLGAGSAQAGSSTTTNNETHVHLHAEGPIPVTTEPQLINAMDRLLWASGR